MVTGVYSSTFSSSTFSHNKGEHRDRYIYSTHKEENTHAL